MDEPNNCNQTNPETFSNPIAYQPMLFIVLLTTDVGSAGQLKINDKDACATIHVLTFVLFDSSLNGPCFYMLNTMGHE